MKSKKIQKIFNGRFVRNIYEKMLMKHAVRTDKLVSKSVDDLMELEVEDFQ